MKRRQFQVILNKETKYYKDDITILFKGILKSKAIPVCVSEGEDSWIQFKVGAGFEEVFKGQIGRRGSFKVIEVIKAVP